MMDIENIAALFIVFFIFCPVCIYYCCKDDDTSDYQTSE